MPSLLCSLAECVMHSTRKAGGIAGLLAVFTAIPCRAATPRPTPPPHPSKDTVVLVHGLGRGPASLGLLARSLADAGYHVVQVRYASQREPIPALAEQTLGAVFAQSPNGGGRTHLVTHSLGGILVRQYLRNHGVPASLGRVVMIAPPNGGSEIVDFLSGSSLYARINGPAGLDLGTAPHHAPAALGPLPAGVEVGVIAGDRSLNPLFSALISGPDDGKVSVARTHVAGETDHVVVPYSHTWLMNRRKTRAQVAAFLRHGRFTR
jgi:pimeloyl-ACP methyl ester carboxylesterase